jgi:hypothetical protein
MKTLNQITKIIIVSIMILFSNQLLAQTPSWILGGNPSAGFNGTSSFAGANQFGTIAGSPDNVGKQPDRYPPLRGFLYGCSSLKY